MQVVEDLTDILDDASGTYVEIGASDDEEEEDQIIIVQMARGRAVDLDASGSGLRGGRGRGRSTCGRGRTIPPPSSSGTSGASSSAQPPVPPSLPSVPSSSTPFLGLVESSQSPTAPASSEPCNKLSLKHFVWEEAIMAMLKVAWEKLCALQYADFTYKMRKSGAMRLAVMEQVLLDTQADQYPPIETSRLLAEKYGREPTSMEVFTYTHTKDHDGNTFVDRRVLGVNVTISGPQPDHSAEEIAALWAHVDEQERQLVELREYVMWMSGQPGAGTSSSDPPPTTDRDVSTTQHQPLPSPLDPDTADNTLVTPADTTTHPANTPPRITRLDCANDQPRFQKEDTTEISDRCL
ncbi:hypothetical protein JCGZ_05776 [Jatropha curcas]|uniref:Uncharacterized protein n=1 Tax=Jatropha curcas TaxID=180498 RepID=A0A067L1A5_JATCU|nr:hypothetical protein JCGZ_05776 [Jatropha curcas]